MEKADSSVNVGISPFAILLAALLNFSPVAPMLNVDFSGSEVIFIDLLIPENMLILIVYLFGDRPQSTVITVPAKNT